MARYDGPARCLRRKAASDTLLILLLASTCNTCRGVHQGSAQAADGLQTRSHAGGHRSILRREESTRSQLLQGARQRQIATMRAWPRELFEDPGAERGPGGLGAPQVPSTDTKAVTLEDVLTMEDHLLNHHPPLGPGGKTAVADEAFRTTTGQVLGLDLLSSTTLAPAERCLAPEPSVTMGFDAVDLQPYLDCLGAYCDDADVAFLDKLLGIDRNATKDDTSAATLGGCQGILQRRRNCALDLSLAYAVPDGTLLGFLCSRSCSDMCSHRAFYRQTLSRVRTAVQAA
eukprot:TRINITY_DN19074_c0_g1_i1.p1 TRINITY_DN19074_c0_g1~~TRINITY_DN19074_c0_g1_i1.p1  ORF type:complete len:313 (+),score=26.60 TRINITY_DN19074_c0_g1_i1:79-939(+)